MSPLAPTRYHADAVPVTAAASPSESDDAVWFYAADLPIADLLGRGSDATLMSPHADAAQLSLDATLVAEVEAWAAALLEHDG